jgi:23S rRNA (guanosine2251-2'-O)-methyltransferase
MPIILGKNPVFEALKTNQSVDKIFIQSGKEGTDVVAIYKIAKEKHIPVVRADRYKLKKMANQGNHQGFLAHISPVAYVPLHNLIDKIHYSGENARILILIDIQDPHNLGAIIRSAEIFGVHGIIFRSRKSVSLTDAVVKTSAGAVFFVDICKVTSLVDTIKYIRDCGILLYSAVPRSDRDLWSVDFTQPHAILIGNEGTGINQWLMKQSDLIFSISQKGKVDSLNVSVATGIILAEVQRQLKFYL